MRLLITSDWHIDAVTFGVPRRRELLAYVHHLRGVIRDQEVDAVVVAGDMFDPGSMLVPQFAADVIHQFQVLSRMSRWHLLVGIAGNHDVVETTELLTTLTPACTAFELMDETPGAESGVAIAEKVSTVVTAECVFLLLPYVARAWVDAPKPGVMPYETLREAVFSEAAHERVGKKLVVVGHLTVPGARMGSESVELSRGRDVDFPVAEVAALKPDLVINGHYHRPQTVDVGPFEIVIPGSPLSFATDDDAAGKGYVIAEV